MGINFIGIEGNRDGYSPDQCDETCTVRELIDALEYFDDDMPVYLINDKGYTYGSISTRDIDEHYVNNDGDLDEEDYEDDEHEEDDDLDECRLHIEESDNSNIKLTINKIAKADTLSQINAALKSLGTTGEKLLTKYAKFMSKAPSPGKVGDVFIKELTKLLQNADDLILTDDCESYKSHMHESHRIRKNKLCMQICLEEPRGDWDAYGRDLSFSNTYDEQSGVWISECRNRNTRTNRLTESVDLTQRFRDWRGMFGEPGSIVTASELKDYWNEEHDWDPVLQDFDSFEDWYYATIEWFEPLYEHMVKKLHIKESSSAKKYTGNTWRAFINDIESNSNYKVDSAYRLKYDQWIELIDDNGVIYDAEVTPIYRGGYELMDYNIHKSYSHNESVCKISKIHIKESAMKNNIENIMYNATLVHDYDALGDLLTTILPIDKDLYNRIYKAYEAQRVPAEKLAHKIYDELADALGIED